MVNLPFLKRRKAPRKADPRPDKLVHGSSSDILEDQMLDELMEAASEKDPTKFRHALEALVMNSFDHGDDDEHDG